MSKNYLWKDQWLHRYLYSIERDAMKSTWRKIKWKLRGKLLTNLTPPFVCNFDRTTADDRYELHEMRMRAEKKLLEKPEEYPEETRKLFAEDAIMKKLEDIYT